MTHDDRPWRTAGDLRAHHGGRDGTWLRLLLALFMLTASGCASAIPPVQLYGDAADLERLVGRWSGEYVGDRAGSRRGSIFFELIAGEDHAHGDVMMTPEGSDQPYMRHPPGAETGRMASPAAPTQFLSIRFVEAAGGVLEGVLDPLWDPERRTQARSTFRGRFVDAGIAGAFVTHYQDGSESTTGTWKVVRQR